MSAGDEGKNAFAKGDYAKAVELFTEALKTDAKNESIYSNRSAAFTKLKKLDEAVADANKCIELKPEWEKGYSRKGSALYLQLKFPEAVAAFAAGLTKDPTNAACLTGLQAAQKAAASKKTKKKRTKKGQNKKNDVDDANLDEESKTEGKDEEGSKDHVIGIDLGTTYSCVGVWKDDSVHIISTDHGEKTIPSYVSFTEEGRRLVGMEAKNMASSNAKNTIFDIKRVIGQRFTDNGVEKDISKFPFKVIKGTDDKPVVEVTCGGKKENFAPEQISSMVLSECKRIAEKYLGEDVHKAVVTCPAYFNDAQRTATKTAGVIAGLEVLRVINEPTAAALSYGLDIPDTEVRAGPTRILIFDLGGGTFDVSILSIEDGIFTVVATGGDTRLGGEDFDSCTMDALLAELDRLNPPGDIRKDQKAYARLRQAAELAKRQLSNATSTEMKLDSLFPNWHFKYKLTRAKFESLNKGHFNLCMDVVKRVLKDSKFKELDIDEIVLVGGSTRIPKLQQMLSHMFQGKKLCKSLNPDEAVAYGAAVQGAILNGKRNSKTKDLLLMDVTPLSLGIETTGRVMSVIIPRNTPIPCVKTQVYTTEANYQTKVDVAVYEGERLKSDENNMLGEFTISGIESAKRGEPQIDVSFAIDSDGILNVQAIDRKTNAKAKIEIANRSEVSPADVERMVADAEKYKAADKERLRKVENRNELEASIFEAFEVADEHDDAKIADVIRRAAEKEQEWLDGPEAEQAKSADFALRRRNLQRRLGSRKPL